MKSQKFIESVTEIFYKASKVGLIFACIILVLLYINNTKLLNTEPIKLEVINIDKTNTVATETEDITDVEKTDVENSMEYEIEQLKNIEDDMLRFIKYKGIVYRYADSVVIEEDPTYNLQKEFSIDEIFLMQRTIETECFECDFMSKVNVASVILNRIKDGRFGETVEEIITSPNQFAYDRRYISYDTVLALEYASYFGDTTDGCLAFRSGDKPEKWGKWRLQFTDNSGHGFYK